MVALVSPEAATSSRRGVRWSWSAATGALLLLGIGVRLGLHPGGVGDRSAAVMIALLGLSAWAATSLLATPRTTLLVTVGLVALLDLAALPARSVTEYDDRQAFYQTDQVLAARVAIPPAIPVNQNSPALTLLVEPIYGGAQPQFGLAGDLNGRPVTWDCAFHRGIQPLGLPVPAAALASAAALDVRLHLTGSPTREADYLLVYASSARGGFLVSLVGATDADPGATTCTLR
jgi:hypothetical protein